MPKPLCSQFKELVAALISYFEKEPDSGGPMLPLTAVRDRVAAPLQLSSTTVNRIAAEVCGGNDLNTRKKRSHCKTVCELSEVNKTEIRNVIYMMYEQKVHIILDRLLAKLKEKHLFEGGRISLWDFK